MLVDFSQTILDLDGERMQLEVKKKGRSPFLTLSIVSTNALLSRFPDEQGITGEEMETRYDLADKIRASEDKIEINPEELVLLRKLIAKGQGPLIATRARRMLNGTPNAPSE